MREIDYLIFAAGWFFGAMVMWMYFLLMGLIRTREEYYAAKERNEKQVLPKVQKARKTKRV